MTERSPRIALLLLIIGSGPAALARPAPTLAAQEEKPPRKASVEAPVLTGITIDGDLSDWPDTIDLRAIDHIHVLPPYYGWNGLEGADLATSPDLSAVFSVAFDPDADLIYLAVIVRDDALIIGHKGFWDTDAVEVYVDGRCSEDSVPNSVVFGRDEEVDASELPLLQYLGVPGEGPIYGVKRSSGQDRGPDNPILMYGDIAKTKTTMKFRRDEGVTVYEWALQAFDRYPDQPTDLVPGKRIGFDVAVADKDVPATTEAPEDEPEAVRVAWLSWHPDYGGPRFLNASHLGEIVLGPAPGTVGD